ncbi:MAG: cation:proton antiporter [Kiritimatiellia bacterium]
MESLHINFLLLTGVALFGGTLGARIFKKIHFPQVVGYIVIGLILGESMFSLIDHATIRMMSPFNCFALGIIGFMIGGELKLSLFKKFGRQFMIILLAEGMGAFLVVSVLSFLVMMLLNLVGLIEFSWKVSLGLALLLGAISSATAPAATVDVLWESRAGGPLTTSVMALVAMDDGLALLLYGLCSSISSAFFGGGEVSVLRSLGMPVLAMGGSVMLGGFCGLVLNYMIRRLRDQDNALTFTIGAVFIVIGGTRLLELDPILASMSLGMTLVNLAPRRSTSAFELVEKFAPPIYVLFFVLVGARMKLEHMEFWVVVIALVYLVGRTAGKILGSRFGAGWAKAPDPVRKYLGLCLFSQAGVAIGLSILASQQFTGELAYVGQTIVIVVTSSTFLVQLIGPPCVKFAVHKAGEAGINITVEDLIASYTVKDVMDKQLIVIDEFTPLSKILDVFSENDALCYPVVNRASAFAGVISFQDIKNTLTQNDLHMLLVAHDLMEPLNESAFLDDPLPEILERMKSTQLDYMPVFENADNRRLIGFLDRSRIMQAATTEILRRERKAESFA